MPEQLLDRVLREIRERLDESRSAYEESQRLEAALGALGSGTADKGHTDGGRPQTPTRRASGHAGSRAPRGESLRRIRAAIDERPGASAGEVASATGIARATVASTLGKLARDGELERADLPGGRVGFRRARQQPGPAGHSSSLPAPDVDAARPGSEDN